MLTNEQITSLNTSLHELLPHLKAGTLECIEYGDKVSGNPNLSYLRIRYIMTAGGEQFQIKTLGRWGLESSGIYTPDATDAIHQAMNIIIHYHRPQGFALKLKELQQRNGTYKEPAELAFFPVLNEDTAPWGQVHHLPEEFLKDVTTVELTLDR